MLLLIPLDQERERELRKPRRMVDGGDARRRWLELIVFIFIISIADRGLRIADCWLLLGWRGLSEHAMAGPVVSGLIVPRF
jgi:hypothetical protein